VDVAFGGAFSSTPPDSTFGAFGSTPPLDDPFASMMAAMHEMAEDTGLEQEDNFNMEAALGGLDMGDDGTPPTGKQPHQWHSLV